MKKKKPEKFAIEISELFSRISGAKEVFAQFIMD
jgi:hypothetical protein